MPLCANQTVTFLHRQYDGAADADVEYETEISGVSVQPKIGSAASAGGAVGADRLQIRIFETHSTASRSGYLPYPEWEALDTASRESYWTLCEGDTCTWQGRTFTVSAFHDNRAGRRFAHIYVEAS